jgi:hypothetical protein
MITIATTVEAILGADEVALAAARQGWLNLSSYARAIQPQVCARLLKDVQEASIVTALSRLVAELPVGIEVPTDTIQGLTVHPNLEGMTYERSAHASLLIRDLYSQVNVDDKTFLTATQGVNEITVVAEAPVAQVFREKLQTLHKIYDRTNLVGVTVKFKVGYLEVPNLIFALVRRLAYEQINIIEIVSTATELTFIIEKADLAAALTQLQKDI